MPRPVKNNAEYFSHDAGMRNNRKIKALIAKHGVAGYAYWNMLLESIAGSDNYLLAYNEDNKDLVAGDLYTTADVLEEVVDFCLRVGLLQLKDGFLYSESFTERMQPLDAKRQQVRERVQQFRKNDCKTGGSVTTGVVTQKTGVVTQKTEVVTQKEAQNEDCNANNCVTMPQSKVKYSKVEKTKVLNISRVARDARDGADAPADAGAVGEPDSLSGVTPEENSRETRARASGSRRPFTPPDVEAVRAWCDAKGYGFDPEEFVMHYTANGWMVGKARMKDWHAACVTWQKDWKRRNPSGTGGKSVGAVKGNGGTGQTLNGIPLLPNGYPVQLGWEERFEPDGRRTYGDGRYTIPYDAPPRPNEMFNWSAKYQNWVPF
ncbi:MAG: DUF4373 domain-containing protein [Prevotella sp.]|nr:DUF4373 domain-containing protein [Prevotella sp.]